MADPSVGHKYGADHIEDVLNWCAKAGIKHVVEAFLCSTENLLNREDAEVAYLMEVIESIVADKLSLDPVWQVHLAGSLDLLPDATARALKRVLKQAEPAPPVPMSP
jgi:short-chain Z-isoprenyl diphosphate synthase